MDIGKIGPPDQSDLDHLFDCADSVCGVPTVPACLGNDYELCRCYLRCGNVAVHHHVVCVWQKGLLGPDQRGDREGPREEIIGLRHQALTSVFLIGFRHRRDRGD